jgi:hypothetical protein
MAFGPRQLHPRGTNRFDPLLAFDVRQKAEDAVDEQILCPHTNDRTILRAHWKQSGQLRRNAAKHLAHQFRMFRELMTVIYGNCTELWEDDPSNVEFEYMN